MWEGGISPKEKNNQDDVTSNNDFILVFVVLVIFSCLVSRSVLSV